MTELSVLERVRAAVAEAGYDPALIRAAKDPCSSFAYSRERIPRGVAWRAREVVGLGDPACRLCTLDATEKHRWIDGCLADRRFVEDCGRDRSEP